MRRWKRRTPWLAGTSSDVLAERDDLADWAEQVAAAASAARLERLARERLPWTVTGAAAIDAVRAAAAHIPTGLLDDTALEDAAARAHLAEFAWADAAPESARGAFWGIRGTAGELWALEELEAGRLPMPDGATAVELVHHNEPGVDLHFVDAAGTEVAAANVKVAATEQVLLRHFGRHPDVALLYATSDAADAAAARGITVVPADAGSVTVSEPTVVDLGLSSADFDREVGGALHSAVSEPAAPGASELAQSVPVVSLAVVAVRAARRLHHTRSIGATADGVGRDLVRTGGGLAGGGIAAAAGGATVATAGGAVVGAGVANGLLRVRRLWRDAAARDADLAGLAEDAADRAGVHRRCTDRGDTRLYLVVLFSLGVLAVLVGAPAAAVVAVIAGKLLLPVVVIVALAAAVAWWLFSSDPDGPGPPPQSR
ncbi:MAG: hypothetical protein JJU45_08150 [Acidimicrobiia bacterium]|nr:hypothetical protein [Acidimicrobiia bacterium]